MAIEDVFNKKKEAEASWWCYSIMIVFFVSSGF